MRKNRYTFFLAMASLCVSASVVADEPSRSEMRSLDEQVQEIKADVLDIASELNLLEERLLFPSNSQLAVFVALGGEDSLRLDAVHLQINGEAAAHYIYSFKELEALQQGGVQRLYTGNLARGDHAMEVSVIGKLPSGKDFTHTETFTFSKGIEPRLLGLTLAGPGAGTPSIQLADW